MTHCPHQTSIPIYATDDGRTVEVIHGFRDRLLNRSSTWPKPDWQEADYASAAQLLIARWRKKLAHLAKWGVQLDGLRVLEIGCGAGLHSLLLGLSGVREVVSTDLRLRIRNRYELGDRSRRLAEEVLRGMGWQDGLEAARARLPIRFQVADVTHPTLDGESFDLVISGSVLEHVKPVDTALSELAKVLRPGGVMYHAIEPFYWLRGCHEAGMVDIPWAHARLSLPEMHRFVTADEGEERAAAVFEKVDSLNRLTLEQYRNVFAAAPIKVLQWKEKYNTPAAELLQEYPEVSETLLPGVTARDLVHGEIDVLATTSK
ncbi:MAG TPA: class I SAM-dependent methyltransferase [Candidatus Nitrosopolaris sp.]|nr:class I SAM-dependent methyltransferase [Candidatus Nitrosopolaris sp.]